MRKDKLLTVFEDRILKYPDFYSDDIKRIIKNIENIDLEPYVLPEVDFNVRDGINILREFFSTIDKRYLDIFNYMISKDLISIEKNFDKDPFAFMTGNCKHFDNCSEDCPDYRDEYNEKNHFECDGFNGEMAIEMNCNSIENMLESLSHEMGHSLQHYLSEKYSFSLHITDETSSQLFSFLASDFIDEKYPRISLKNEENLNLFDILDNNSNVQEYVDFALFNSQSNLKRKKFFENMRDYEENTQYVYSYFLAYKIYSDYVKSKSLVQVDKLLYNKYKEKDDLLVDLGINKRSVGTKRMIKEIKNRFN